MIAPKPEQLRATPATEVKFEDFEGVSTRDDLAFIQEQTGQLDVNIRAYVADIEELDRQVGRLIEEPEVRNLRENTLIVFASDNGPGLIGSEEEMAARIGKTPKLANNVASSGPFRSRKNSLYEGGVRVPLIVNWPGQIEAGATSDARVRVAGAARRQPVEPDATFASFDLDLDAGPSHLHTWFDDARGQPLLGAYYVYVERHPG